MWIPRLLPALVLLSPAAVNAAVRPIEGGVVAPLTARSSPAPIERFTLPLGSNLAGRLMDLGMRGQVMHLEQRAHITFQNASAKTALRTPTQALPALLKVAHDFAGHGSPEQREARFLHNLSALFDNIRVKHGDSHFVYVGAGAQRIDLLKPGAATLLGSFAPRNMEPQEPNSIYGFVSLHDALPVGELRVKKRGHTHQDLQRDPPNHGIGIGTFQLLRGAAGFRPFGVAGYPNPLQDSPLEPRHIRGINRFFGITPARWTGRIYLGMMGLWDRIWSLIPSSRDEELFLPY